MRPALGWGYLLWTLCLSFPSLRDHHSSPGLLCATPEVLERQVGVGGPNYPLAIGALGQWTGAFWVRNAQVLGCIWES